MTNPKNAKLTPERAKALWDMRGKASQRERAKLFGVSRGLVGRIDAGWSWRSVTGLPPPEERART